MADVTAAPSRRSKLVPIGLVLILSAFLLPRIVFRFGNSISEYSLRLAVIILGDVLLAGFWAGLGVLTIGLLRNRRWKVEASKAPAPPPFLEPAGCGNFVGWHQAGESVEARG